MALLLNHVEHVYGKGTAFEKVALYDINLQINEGEFIGLIGHTGSGKSTLIQHVGFNSPFRCWRVLQWRRHQ